MVRTKKSETHRFRSLPQDCQASETGSSKRHERVEGQWCVQINSIRLRNITVEDAEQSLYVLVLHRGNRVWHRATIARFCRVLTWMIVLSAMIPKTKRRPQSAVPRYSQPAYCSDSSSTRSPTSIDSSEFVIIAVELVGVTERTISSPSARNGSFFARLADTFPGNFWVSSATGAL